MSEIVNNVDTGALIHGEDSRLELRILRNMIVAITVAVVISTLLAPWRVTSGLLLGGALALFNHHWLQTSIAVAFRVDVGKRPRVRAWRYLLRYLVVGATVLAAYRLNLVSLPATIAGLSVFVVAIFAEAFRSFYFIMFHREGY